ncbi:hypothetical protein KKI95_16670 [Xenorhabdus bovienii]|uniref:hypothetical protein n=1 Tax=Xenorhabdus bovienii TaxID=40576 RepID=UPI00237C9C9C|nr:hypothetical protein [Xenorhabdus bovienii]MDE1484108.1 hypothetical protein [Xenorhabdus bovienii]MDE9437520.1 hypothetical protein [Xenorhabdus bovienii]MDE9517852.1 hypothetical protein [Xenorhabdus bovienii]
MSKYTLEITITDTGNKEIQYSTKSTLSKSPSTYFITLTQSIQEQIQNELKFKIQTAVEIANLTDKILSCDCGDDESFEDDNDQLIKGLK